LRQAITSMVQECMTFLDSTPDLDTKVALIKTLVTVSAGKVRRSWLRLTLSLAHARRADLRGG
jgi:26S proteasome regulatory subunit N5